LNNIDMTFTLEPHSKKDMVVSLRNYRKFISTYTKKPI